MNAKHIKIKFLNSVLIPQAVWKTHCQCCGAKFDGWQSTYFFKHQEIDPNEQYEQVDLRDLVFGRDYIITEFIPDSPEMS